MIIPMPIPESDSFFMHESSIRSKITSPADTSSILSESMTFAKLSKFSPLKTLMTNENESGNSMKCQMLDEKRGTGMGVGLPVIHLDSGSLPAKTVLVYTDRAEVKRVVHLNDINASEQYLLHIDNVSPMIEKRSIKVDGQHGVRILEVNFEEISNHGVGELEKKIADLERSRVELELDRAALSDQIEVIRRRLEVLDGVAKQVGQSALVNSTADGGDAGRKPNGNQAIAMSSAFLLCEDTINNLTTFLDYYGKTAIEMRNELRDKEKQAFTLKEKFESVELMLDQLRCKHEYDSHKRRIRIVVESEPTASSMELHVQYQVYCVGWRPTYSLRASTSGLDQDCVDSVLLAYDALVEQRTDEPWNHAELILSTAQPCLNGVLPTPPTVQAALLCAQQRSFRPRNQSSIRRKQASAGGHNGGSQEDDGGIGSYSYHDFMDAGALQRWVVAEQRSHQSSEDDSAQQANLQTPSVYFPVEMPASVPGDGHPTKVNIATVELEPNFIHEIVPSRSTAAYVAAVLKNTSQMAFIPGQLAVFLNNSFVSTSHLKRVLPGEEFQCLLGVDPSVKVEYKKTVRQQEQIGFMSKCCLSVHEHTVSLRNAKVGQNARVTIREPIPKAVDDKIKVSLVHPELNCSSPASTKHTRTALHNQSSNEQTKLTKEGSILEWTCVLGPGEPRDLVVRWSAEYPLGEQVVFSQQFPGSINGTAAAPPSLLNAGRVH